MGFVRLSCWSLESGRPDTLEPQVSEQVFFARGETSTGCS